MGIGALTISPSGAITRPSTLPWSAGASIQSGFKDYGRPDMVWLPALKGVLFCNGMDFQYHVIDSVAYLTGPLAPAIAPTVTPSSARATATYTPGGTPANGTTIQVGKPGGAGAGYVVFKTTLDTTGTENQVLIGGSATNALANLQKLINNTGTHGTDFWSGRMAMGEETPGFDTNEDITAPTLVAGTSVTFRSRTYGTIGNTYNARDVSGTAGFGGGTLMTGGSAGTYGTDGGPGVGAYTWGYCYYRAGDQAMTAMSPTTAEALGTNTQVSVAFTAALSRDGIGYYRPFRTTIDGAIYYKLGDTSSSPWTDDDTDTIITGDFKLLYDPVDQRPYAGGYPPRFRCAMLHQGSVVGAGAVLAAKVDDGTTASVTKGNYTVTLSATAKPKADWIGRIFQVDGTAEEYVICDVDASVPSLRLTQLYVGATDGTASYTVTDKRDPCAVYWTPPNKPNQWPVANELRGIYTPDAEGVVACAEAFGEALFFTRTGAWRFIGTPSTGFEIRSVPNGKGVYSTRSVQVVGGVVYGLGPDGAWEWAGKDAPMRSISDPDPAEAGDAVGISETLRRINDDAVNGIVSNHNASEGILRWAVPLDGSPYNRWILVYDLKTGAWALDKVPPITCLETIYDPSGTARTVGGTPFGTVWQFDVGTCDGCFGVETVQEVSSYDATTLTITLDGSPGLPTSGDGLKGVPLVHVDADGDFQRGEIESNTSSTVVLVGPLAQAPVDGDKILLGSILARWRTSKFDGGAPDTRKVLTSVTLAFEPSTGGQAWCAVGLDNDDPTVRTPRGAAATDSADLTLVDGEYQFMFWRGKGRRVQVEVVCPVPGHEVRLVGYVPTIRGPWVGEVVS